MSVLERKRFQVASLPYWDVNIQSHLLSIYFCARIIRQNIMQKMPIANTILFLLFRILLRLIYVYIIHVPVGVELAKLNK